MNKNVLIVDDDVSILEGFGEILSENGYSVEKAENEAQALKFLSNQEYQIAIVDLILKKSSGLDLIAKIKKFSSDTSIIAMTGYASTYSASDCLKCGAFEFIEKPFDAEYLLEAVDRGFERKIRHKNDFSI